MSRTSHTKALRLRLIPAALGMGAVIALAGCSAGQVTETDTQVSAVNGASGQVKDLSVRDAQFSFPSGKKPLYPAGSSAPMELVLVNGGDKLDRLVQVSSPYAASGRLAGTTDLPGRTALRAMGEPAEPTIQGHPSDQKTVTITLDGLKQDIRPGVTIPVTFVFANSGAVTVQVPIGPDHKPRPERGSPEPASNH